MDKQQVWYKDLGLIDYADAWAMQENLLASNVAIKTEARAMGDAYDANVVATKNHFLFCEHHPVYTLGKSGSEDNILYSLEERLAKNISFFKTNRGGDVTFHGPQQLVGYPIMDLEKFGTDIGKYLRNIEEVIILAIADYGIKGERSKGETGVWIDAEKTGHERKICAIGVRCSRWITMHGFAVNVNTDLSYFDGIVPCGIQNKKVTSIKQELGRSVDFEAFKNVVKDKFAMVFDCELL